jgi:tetratricopeptide (TPR) repeat protein
MSMRVQPSFARLLLVAIVTGAVSTSAQTPAGRPGGAPDTIVKDVRTALGHGAVADARRLADGSTAPAASKAFASALIDIFEGKDEEARVRLAPLSTGNPQGEAALELGLLHMRHGRRDEARQLLNPISDSLYNRYHQGQVLNDDDYYRLARAALALGKVQLANDAYKLVKGPRPDVQTAWGDMFLARHKADLAAESYRVALAADPAWVRAHIGLARAFGDDDPAAAAAAFEAARKQASDHPDVWLTVAQRRIEVDDRAGAVEALDQAAKVRAGSMDEAALRVAVAFEAKDPAVLAAALKRVEEIDPRSARGLRAAGQQAAHDYRFDEASVFAKQAVERDPDDAAAHAELGLYFLRTGDEQAARAELDQSWALDTSDPVTKNLLDLLDSLDKFEVVSDGPFIYKFPAADAAVLKPYALPLGALAYKTFSERYGFTPKGPILVEMFAKHDDFAVRTVGLMGITGALGACFGRVVTMDEPRARPPGEFSWHATEWHELAHVFTLQLSNYRVPRWLTEGISVYEEYRKQPAWGRELTLEFAAALGRGKTFGVKGLSDAFKNPENYSLAYFEASLVVEHLVTLNGDAGLRTLLKAYADGATDTEAFTRAFGKDLDAVDTSFKAFIEQRYGAMRDAMKAPARDVDPEDLEGLKARAAAAPGNFISQLTLGQALVKSGDFAAARAPLERAAELAPPASGNASPHALLALTAEKNGDEARARKELRALLTYDHANVNAARHLASLAAAAKSAEDQDFALRLVTDLDPYDADAHGLLGRRLLAQSNFAGALVEFQATMALGPVNLAEAHADVAEALLKLGRRDEARKEALAALKEAPTFARAQDLLLAAMGKD